MRIGRSGRWIGLENFEFMFEDPIFWNAVFYSVFYTGVATVGKFADDYDDKLHAEFYT